MKRKMLCLAVAAAMSVAGSAMATLIYPSAPVTDASGCPTEEKVVESVVSAFWKRDIDLGLLYKDDSIVEGDATGITVDPGFVSGTSLSYDVSWGLAARDLYANVAKAGRLGDIYLLGDTEQLTESGETYTVTTSGLQGISHVSSYGVSVNMPDGGTTLILLGLALCVGVLVTWRLKK